MRDLLMFAVSCHRFEEASTFTTLKKMMRLWGEVESSAVEDSMAKPGYVYMLASARYGTLYIGVTSDLIQRTWQHCEGVVEGFTQQHGVKTLV